MSLLDRLREAQDEPARHRASPYVGPSILSVGQLRAMERALAREGFFDRETTGPEVVDEAALWAVLDEPVEPVRALVPVPRFVAVDPVVEPLPTWTPPDEIRVTAKVLPPAPHVEPLPVWTPPGFEPVTKDAFDPCPNCGDEVAIDRIDLTTNASWLTCRGCGLRWSGPVDQSSADEKSGERGQIASG